MSACLRGRWQAGRAGQAEQAGQVLRCHRELSAGKWEVASCYLGALSFGKADSLSGCVSNGVLSGMPPCN